MIPTLCRLLLVLALLSLVPLRASAVIGYANHPFSAGDNLFENSLSFGGNDLNSMFDPTTTPNGTQISLWNPATLSYTTTSTFLGGTWSLDLVLNPGTGARLTTPASFTNTFVGTVLDHDGSLYQGDGGNLPPPYSGPNGVFLLGDKFPASSSGSAIFTNILGRGPNNGDEIIRLDAATQSYITSTYNSVTGWDITPTFNVGDALFLDLGGVAFTPPPLTTVPEPSVAAVALFGLALFRQHLGRKG